MTSTFRRFRRMFRTQLIVPATPFGGSFPVDRDRERVLADLRALRDPEPVGH